MASTVTEAALSVLERNLDQLAGAGTRDQIKALLPEITDEIEEMYSPRTDRYLNRTVVIILGAVVIIVVLTYALNTLLPAMSGKTAGALPDAMIALGSAAIGALAGLLAPPASN